MTQLAAPSTNRRVPQVSLLRPGIRATCPACPGVPWGVPRTDPKWTCPAPPRPSLPWERSREPALPRLAVGAKSNGDLQCVFPLPDLYREKGVPFLAEQPPLLG